MTVIKSNSGLEGFVERHRAELDAFEPRLDLWDAIEARLDAPTEAAAAPDEPTPAPVLPLQPAPTATPGTGWQRYAAAAAVALLLLAGGYGLRRTDAPTDVAAGHALLAEQPQAVQQALRTDTPDAMTVGSNSPARRLAASVRRMEAYYAAQLSEKQHELSLLDAGAAPGTVPQAADWKVEIAALDSAYRQLRADLYQSPDPNAMLDAMNENLQFRLDILNQQLRTREQIRQYHDDAYNQTAAQK